MSSSATDKPDVIDVDLESQLRRWTSEALVELYPDVAGDVDPSVRPSRFADYQVNCPLQLGKKLGRPPRDVAGELVEEIRKRAGSALELIEPSGPGFLNCTFSNGHLGHMVDTQRVDAALGRALTTHAKTFVVDYAAPNVAKEMHVGHIRSTLIGDCIVRILEASGHKVIRQNHLGDWGTQFGMLVQFLDESEQDESKLLRADDLEVLYRAARAKFDSDEAFKQRARDRVVGLQNGDPATIELWEKLVAVSKENFDHVFEVLGVTLGEADYRGESMYNDMLDGVVDELRQKGLLVESQGAQCVFPDGFKDKDGNAFPLMVQKSNGGFGYAATDLATLKHTVESDRADVALYVVDARQSQHFAMVFEVARMAGWLDQTEAVHIAFGMVMGKDNKPFKTREGNTVRLVDLLDLAVAKSTELVDDRHSDWSSDEIKALGQAVGIGAVKWMELKSDRSQNYVFDVDTMTSFDGNTGPYIQYALTRAKSILRKADSNPAQNITIAEEGERDLALALLGYGRAVAAVLDGYEPHVLCTYIYDLANTFSSFYEKCPVLASGVEERVKRSRLTLCGLFVAVLEDAMSLIGLQALERM